MPSPLRRSWPATLIILIVAILAAYDRLPRRSSARNHPTDIDLLADDHARYHDRDFRIVKVIDGDTLDFEAPDRDHPTTRVRLWGVDCPEPGHGGVTGMHFGDESVQFARQMVQGKSVHVLLSPKQTRDRHGRLLAYVFLERGGAMFNELLVEQGYGYADRRFPHHYSDRFEAAERRAKRDKLGLWRDFQINSAPDWYQRIVLSKPD
jgi:micrococcal nuclease